MVVGIGDDVAPVVTSRRRLYAAGTMLLTAIVGLAALDGVDAVDAFGVDTSTVTASGGGYDLAVRYGSVSRPALATPFDIEVVRPDGFAGPVRIGVTSAYLRVWDENGLWPEPSSETSSGEWILWEFDPPRGTALSLSFDARIEPAVQTGRSGRVAVFDNGVPVVSVSFHTRVMP